MPVIVPVLALSDKPVGNAPALTANVYGETPLAAVIDPE
jgi:hypothetical protein